MSAIAGKAEKKESYEAIIKLYDKAEELIEAVETLEFEQPEKALDLVEPVVIQLEESTGILSEAFITYGETGQKLDAYNKKKAETAIRKLFTALNNFCESVEVTLLGAKAAVDMNASDLRIEIVNLQEKVKKKHGDKFSRIFAIMIWIGDYVVKLAKTLEKVGLGIQSALAVPGLAGTQQYATDLGSLSFQQAAEARGQNAERGWSL